MEESMNSKERILLEYIRTRYNNTLDVKMRIPTNDYCKIGIENSDELCKLLMALSIRNYICLNTTNALNILALSEFTLTEKALNIFNEKREEK